MGDPQALLHFPPIGRTENGRNFMLRGKGGVLGRDRLPESVMTSRVPRIRDHSIKAWFKPFMFPISFSNQQAP